MTVEQKRDHGDRPSDRWKFGMTKMALWISGESWDYSINHARTFIHME